jgi:hypothetical protein
MPGIFGDETIPVYSESPEGHDEETAVETENEEDFDNDQDVDSEDEQESEDNADTTDSDADEDQEEEHSEELLAGKYKTPEDLVKGYKELERQFHQSRSSGGQQQQPANQTAVVQQPGEQTQQPDLNNVFWERFRDNPLATMEAVIGHIVNDRTAPIFEERRSQSLSSHISNIAKSYPQVGTEEGLKQLVDKVREFADEVGNPDLLRNPTDKIMRFAAREAFGDTVSKAFEKGKAAGRSESERTRQSKQGLGAKGGAKKQSAPAKTEEQEMVDNILAAGRGGGIFG